ncbi:MAG: LacI family DNA-binding transcriptional regulator [Geminicoccaceae bacterium]|nr:LacI family DNA-binding transcriptional regulator [Geminicoccaceae bacterium]
MAGDNGRDGEGWATMGEVAARAGVSPMTVSRVLKEPGRVRPTTRTRVEAAIAELGYVPDAAAGALASRQSRLVAALVSTLAGSIFASTIAGLGAVLREAGHELLLGTTEYSSSSEEALLRAVLGRRPGGLVLSAGQHTPAARRLLERATRGLGVPVVEIWQLPERPVDMAVGFSNFAAGRAMTAFLADLGYRRIAFVGVLGPDDFRGLRRHAGYREALAERGLGEPRAFGSGGSGGSVEDGARGLAAVLERWPDCDAVFCGSDPLAFGAIAEAARRGLAVPGELAVAGFGDFDYAGEAGLALTTVRIPGERIGRETARLLLERKAGRLEGPVVVDLGFELVRRRTA